MSQGIALEPLLFLIYTNDLVIGMGSNVSKFAGGMKIHKSIMSDLDGFVLQTDSDGMHEWTDR